MISRMLLNAHLHACEYPVAGSSVSAVRRVTSGTRQTGVQESNTYALAVFVTPNGVVAKRRKDGIVALPVRNPLSVSMSFLRKYCRAFRVKRNEQAYTARCVADGVGDQRGRKGETLTDLQLAPRS